MGRKKPVFYVSFACLSVLAGIYLLPLAVTFTNSFMSEAEILRRYGPDAAHFSLTLAPDMATFGQYIKLLIMNPLYINMFWNTMRIVFPVISGQICLSALAAYAYSNSRSGAKNIVFFLYLLVMLMPIQLTLVPHYIIADILGIRESVAAIILPGIFHPLGTVLLSFYMVTIPKPCMEAARLDGANHLHILFHITVPFCKPMLVTVFFITFAENWNLIEQPLIFIRDEFARPLSVFLSRISKVNIDIAFAASCFYILPAVISFFWSYDSLLLGVSGIKE